MKILLVQLAANGDCLFVTPIAKQIKEIDFPDCHLTWLIGTQYKQVLKNNPYIDEIIEIPSETKEDIGKNRKAVFQHISSLGEKIKYDKIFITDFVEHNIHNCYGTTRSMLLRNYPLSIKIDPHPLIFLDHEEVEEVNDFCKVNRISNQTFNVLFECSPQSGQSLMTLKKAIQIAKNVICKNESIKFILTSKESFTNINENIIDGSSISFRANAELANHCNLLVGCSSGISWLCTSNHTKRIPFIQIIDPNYPSASMKTDFRFFGFKTDFLIELFNPNDNIVENCIIFSSYGNFSKAKRKFDQNYKNAFSDCRFLKESKINLLQKGFYVLKFCTLHLFLEKYRYIKPDWFTPKVWYKSRLKLRMFR